MRICYTSDLHGLAALYGQLEELLRVETPDLLILGGDLLVDGTPDDPRGTQVQQLQRELIPRIAVWRAALPGLQVACIPGNHEWACTVEALRVHHAAGRIVLLDHRQIWRYGGVSFVGYPSTRATPHWGKDFERLDLPGDPVPEFGGVVWDAASQCVCPVETRAHFCGRASIAEELAEAPPVTSPWILVSHTPARDTPLDLLPKIGLHAGSQAVGRFILERRPLVALHGHMHDAPRFTGQYHVQLGETLCVNPGQSETLLHAVLFDAARPAATLRHTVFR